MNDTMKVILIPVLLMVLLFVPGCIVSYTASFNNHAIEGTVTDKVVKVDGKVSRYLIFIESNGNDVVLENTDCLWRSKWNSSDVYAGIKIGKTYRFDIIGYRIRFLSWYENILRATETKKEIP